MVVVGLLPVSSIDADARQFKDRVQGATIGAGLGFLVDGGRGVLAGATAGVLIAAVSRRSR